MQNFITFEGGEGAGKTTLIAKLEEYCNAHNIKCVTTREPGGLEECEYIRKLLKSSRNLSSKTQLLLFSACRSHLCEKFIIPNLSSGKIVFCDRFYDSTRVYQGYVSNLSDKYIMQTTNFAVENVKPQLTFYLDIDPVIAFNRKGGADKEDAFEEQNLDYHKKIREGFNKLAVLEPSRIVKIDASQSADKVFKDVLNILIKENVINA